MERQQQTLKDRYLQYCEDVEALGETPVSLSEFIADLADEIRERSKYDY